MSRRPARSSNVDDQAQPSSSNADELSAFIGFLQTQFGLPEAVAGDTISQGILSTQILRGATRDDLREIGWGVGHLIQFRQWNGENQPSTSAGTTSFAPPKDLPVFDIDSRWSARTFIDEFNLVCDAYNFPTVRRPLLLVSRLRGIARQWGRLNVDQTQLWTDVQRRFLEHYYRPDEHHALREALYSIRQRPDERVQTYAVRLQEIAYRLSEDLNSAAILHLFKRGLTNPLQTYYATAISIVTPGTYEDAVSQAVKLEVSIRRGEKKSNLPKSGKAPAEPRSTDPQKAPQNSNSKDKPKSKQGVTCFACNEKGHYRSQCPKKEREVKTSDVLDFDEALKPGPSSLIADGPPSTTDLEVEVDLMERAMGELLGSHMEDGEVEFFTLSKQDRIAPEHIVEGPVRVPIVINESRTFALIDSGASHSCVSHEFAQTLGEPITKADGRIIGATGSSLRIGVVNLALEFGNHHLRHDFEIVPAEKYPIIIGRDLFKNLGLSITGLPATWPRADRRASLEHDDEKLVADEDADGWIPLPIETQKQIHGGISKMLVENNKTSWFCSYPQASIPIKTGEH